MNRDDHERAADLRERGRTAHRGGGAGDLEDDVRARTDGPLLDVVDLVGRDRVERGDAEFGDMARAARRQAR